MTTAESVLLPAPLGPITTYTSPLDTDRSMPRRISLPPTAARRPRISNVLIAAPPLPAVTVTVTASSTSSAVNTGTGWVAGSVTGSPVTRLNVLPCFGHSSSRSSHHTSPSASDTLAWLHTSPMA